jgi:predicted MFS family arabinose efflux permease
MGRLDRRMLAYAGGFLALGANALAIVTQSYENLLLVRPLAGVGAGLVMACGNATVANAKNPERFASHMSILCVALMIVVMGIFSRVGEAYGLAGIYAAMAAIIALMCLVLHHLPRHTRHSQDSSDRPVTSELNALKTPGLLMLAAFLAFSLRDTMAWAFVERIGIDVGYSGEQIGNLLSLQAIVGIIGPVAASVIGSRFGLKVPISTGIFLSGFVTYLVSQSSDSRLLYTLCIMGMPGTYFFTLAYLTALAAELDRQGRIVAASGSALMAGIAIGPAVGGELIVAGGGYRLVGLATILCVLLTYLFILIPMLSAQRGRQAGNGREAESRTAGEAA